MQNTCMDAAIARSFNTSPCMIIMNVTDKKISGYIHNYLKDQEWIREREESIYLTQI